MDTERGMRTLTARDGLGRVRRYRVRPEPLGEGTGSVVFAAERFPDVEGDEGAGAYDLRPVVLKVSLSPKWQGRLAREGRLLKQLQERGAPAGQTYRIVRLRGDGEPLELTDGTPGAALELEFLDGETLRSFMDGRWKQRRPDLPPSELVVEVLGLVGELAEALDQIGRLGDGIVHRDVKPDNVMRTSQGLRLFDFNVSKELDEEDMTTAVGTLHYRAPEVLEGSPYDRRADLWSVGVIAWELVHGGRFDRLADCESGPDGELSLRWPTADGEALPAAERDAIGRLLGVLVADPDHRLPDASALCALVDELRRPYETAAVEEQLAQVDLVGLLFELRPGGLAAVVADTPAAVPQQELQTYLRQRMHVEDPLEGWLEQEIRRLAGEDRQGPALIVLAGNAGDGKSHLLRRVMRERLANTPLVTEQVRYIADATHALRPDASQTERLAQFFSPFADDAGDGEGDRRVHVIAMNTGMVIRFFEGEYEERFRALARTLQGRLGLRGAREADADPPWPVEVVNLDLRSLLSGTGDAPSFFERMLDRLDPAASSGLVAAKAGACASCSARPLCPVRYNLEALTMPRPRQALLSVLRQAALDPDVHLSPRNLWGFLYRLVTGGSERYDGAAGAGGPCGLVRERAATDEAGHGDWLLAGQLTEVLFDQAGAGTPWSSLAQLDPAFVTAPDLDDLHTRLTIRAELDNDPELVTSMGGQGHSLAGLALDKLASRLSAAAPRRDAAVRRAAFFATAEQQAWAATDEETEFGALLTAYERYSAGALLEGSDKESLKRLRDLVQEVFLLGVGRRLRGREYLRVSQPNARGSSELLVAADKPALAREFRVQDLIVRDAHLEAHGGSSQVIRLLGYTPRTVTIKVAGVQVVVDRRMFAFLRRVDAGQKPSVRDLAGFQALVFIGDRLGNRIAAGEHGRMELFIWDAQGERLHRLAHDDFGEPLLEEA